MKKVTFTRTATGRAGKVFEAGKSYWLAMDSYVYWQGEDAIIEAAADAIAENEPPSARVDAQTVRLRRVRGGKFHVYGPGNVQLTDDPLPADIAERFRQDVIEGKRSVPPAPVIAATVVESAPAPESVDAASTTEASDEGGPVGSRDPADHVQLSSLTAATLFNSPGAGTDDASGP